ncbi:MAG: hypothetical protein ABFD50_06650 [Smithella sp.]
MLTATNQVGSMAKYSHIALNIAKKTKKAIPLNSPVLDAKTAKNRDGAMQSPKPNPNVKIKE